MSDKLVLMGDFNCKKVCWEKLTTEGGESSWRNILLHMIIKNTVTQWVQQNNRYKSNNEPSQHDLIFSKEPEIV